MRYAELLVNKLETPCKEREFDPCCGSGRSKFKESVKAKLKVIVKRTLLQFGYPPDMQLLATEMVLKQAEMIANELAA